MGIIKSEDIVAYRVDDQIICPDCLQKEYPEGIELTEEMIIERTELENSDDLWFCDIHGGQIE